MQVVPPPRAPYEPRTSTVTLESSREPNKPSPGSIAVGGGAWRRKAVARVPSDNQSTPESPGE